MPYKPSSLDRLKNIAFNRDVILFVFFFSIFSSVQRPQFKFAGSAFLLCNDALRITPKLNEVVSIDENYTTVEQSTKVGVVKKGRESVALSLC